MDELAMAEFGLWRRLAHNRAGVVRTKTFQHQRKLQDGVRADEAASTRVPVRAFESDGRTEMQVPIPRHRVGQIVTRSIWYLQVHWQPKERNASPPEMHSHGSFFAPVADRKCFVRSRDERSARAAAGKRPMAFANSQFVVSQLEHELERAGWKYSLVHIGGRSSRHRARSAR